MERALLEGARTEPAAQSRSCLRPLVQRLFRYLVQATFVTLLILFLQGAGGRLITPPGLFDRAIHAFHGSTAQLVAYDLGVGARLPVQGAGFAGLEQVLARAWNAAVPEAGRDEVAAAREGDVLILSWTGSGPWGRWQVTGLREDGAPWATVWVRATGATTEGLHAHAHRLLDVSNRLWPAAGRWHFVRLEGRYAGPMTAAARQAVGASLARAVGADPSLNVHLAAAGDETRLIIETPGPSPEDLPLPTYAQVR